MVSQRSSGIKKELLNLTTESNRTGIQPPSDTTPNGKTVVEMDKGAQKSFPSSKQQDQVKREDTVNVDAQAVPLSVNPNINTAAAQMPGLQANLDSGQLAQDLLTAKLANPSVLGNNPSSQMNLQMLKTMMEANSPAVGAPPLGLGATSNQDLLNAAGFAGNPALSLALLGKDAGGLANQLALASNLNQNQGTQNSVGLSSIVGIKNAGLKSIGNNPKNSLGSDPSGGAKLPSDDVNNFDPLHTMRMAHALNTATGAALESKTGTCLDLQQQTNLKGTIGEVGLENLQTTNPALAALLENSGNGAKALNLSQPYIQTLQSLVQQQQQQNQQHQQQQKNLSLDQAQQQLLQLQQNQQQGNPPNIAQASDFSSTGTIKSDSPNSTNKAKGRTSITPNDTYRDFSRVGDDGTDLNSNQPPGKDPPFPVKLHRILSSNEYSDVISWLPHGRSWRVLKPKAFEEKVIPLYFRHAKYASFMRQVNGWGFKRMTQGPDHNSYYHELFLRGMQHLCYKMRRPTRARVDSDPDFNPDFYRLSMVAPLPTQDVSDMNAPLQNVATMNINGLVGNSNTMSTISNMQPDLGLTNSGLQALNGTAGLAGVGGLAGMNNLGAVTSGDNSLSATLLQQQLSQNQNLNAARQLPGLTQSLTQGLQNSGNSFMGVGPGNSEIGQLESLRQRKEELFRQLQRMVNGGNMNTLPNSSISAPAPAVNTNGLMNTNAANSSNLANGLGNPNNLLNLSNQAQLQQMMSLGMNGSGHLGSQNIILPNAASLGTNASQVGLNMNNVPPNLSNLGGSIASGINHQLLMQNSMLGSGGMNQNLSLGGLGNANMMTQNLGAMLQANQLMTQQNQFMGQTNQNSGPPSARNNFFGDRNNNSSA